MTDRFRWRSAAWVLAIATLRCSSDEGSGPGSQAGAAGADGGADTLQTFGGAPFAAAGDGGAAGAATASSGAPAAGDTGQAGSGGGAGEATLPEGGGAADGGANASGTNAGGNGGVSEAGAAATCSEGEACSIDGANGLCRDGACSACVGPNDDGACQTAYGAARLCLDGACAPGECRTEDDCAGAPCINSRCTPCESDAGCDGDMVCLVSSGLCVDPAQCGAVALGGVCPVNPADICCGEPGSLVCMDAECCDDDQCDADTECVAGACVEAGCQLPTDGNYYVDPATAGGSPGTGSAECPFARLTRALNVVGSSGEPAAIITLIGDTDPNSVEIDATTEADDAFPFEMPPLMTTIVGEGQRPTILVPPGGTGFRIQGSDARFENLEIVREGSLDQLGAAIAVSESGSAGVMNVLVSHFTHGLGAFSNGTLRIGPGNIVTDCQNGVFVGSGAAAIASIGADEEPTHFEGNVNGIWVDDPGGDALIEFEGGRLSEEPGSTIVVSLNQNLGIRISGGGSYLFDGVSISDNLGNGLVILGSDTAVRNSIIRGNLGNGIRVRENAAGESFVVLLGSLPEDGLNTFASHDSADFCLATEYDGTLDAEGNAFDDVDCSQAEPTAELETGGCGADVPIGLAGGAMPSMLSIANCDYSAPE